MIKHIISEYCKLTQKEYKTQHDWVGKAIPREFCKLLKFYHIVTLLMLVWWCTDLAICVCVCVDTWVGVSTCMYLCMYVCTIIYMWLDHRYVYTYGYICVCPYRCRDIFAGSCQMWVTVCILCGTTHPLPCEYKWRWSDKSGSSI